MALTEFTRATSPGSVSIQYRDRSKHTLHNLYQKDKVSTRRYSRHQHRGKHTVILPDTNLPGLLLELATDRTVRI